VAADYDPTLALERAYWNLATHPVYDGVVRVMAAGELPRPDAGFSMRGYHRRETYNVTMQVCLDAENDEAGSGVVAFPAEQRRARVVFTSLSSRDAAPNPSRADVADILGPRAAWSSEHDAAAAGGGAG
jgi:hypothetical protein